MTALARARDALARAREAFGDLPSGSVFIVHSSADFVALLREHYGPVLQGARPERLEQHGIAFAGSFDGVPVYSAPWLVLRGDMKLVTGQPEPQTHTLH